MSQSDVKTFSLMSHMHMSAVASAVKMYTNAFNPLLTVANCLSMNTLKSFVCFILSEFLMNEKCKEILKVEFYCFI